MLVRLLLFFLLLNIGPALTAQLHYPGRTFTTSDGLSDNRITAVYKDHTGFIWVGTRNGLNQFDGHRFTTFRPQPGNAISNEVINSITGDSSGRIWVATMEGLNAWEPASNRWRTWKPRLRATDPPGLPSYVVWQVEPAPGGALWIASDMFAFSRFDPATESFTYFDWPRFARDSLRKIHPGTYASIQRFAAINETEFWLGTTKGLVHLNTTTGRFRFMGGGYYGNVTDLVWDAASRTVWLSVEGGRAFSYHEPSGRYRAVPVVPAPYPSTTFPAAPTKHRWMASAEGLLQLNPSTGTATLFRSLPELADGMPPGGVQAVYDDRTGLRWIGTSNGLHIRDIQRPATAFLPLLRAAYSEGSNRMGGVHYSNTTGLYFVCATEPAAVFVISAQQGTIRQFTADGSGRPFSACLTVRTDGAGTTWLLTATDAYRYNTKTAAFDRFPTSFSGPGTLFRDVATDARGNTWFATFGKGAFYYQPATRSFHTIHDPKGIYLQRVTTALAAGPVTDSSMWIATYGNYLYRYHLPTGRLTIFHETDSSAGYAPLNMVHDLVTDSAGHLWAATAMGGLFRYQPGGPHHQAFAQFDMHSGLRSNSYHALAAGSGSRLWLMNGTGLSVASFAAGQLKEQALPRFTVSAFDSDPSFPHHIYYAAPLDQVLVAAGGGLILEQATPRPLPSAFPLLVTRVIVNRDTLQPEQFSKGAIAMSYSDNLLQFCFAGLYFGGDPRLVYEYRLRGADTAWQASGETYQAVFKNLSWGTYHFELRVRIGDTVICQLPTPLHIRIRTPFWASWLFVAGCLFLAGFLIFRLLRHLQHRVDDEQLLNRFATSLYGKNTIDDMFWDVADNCIRLLQFEDCVIYQYDQQRQVLVQRAAAGPKSPYPNRQIINPLELPVGKGIVGTVAATGRSIRIRNTANDPRYVVDDERRYSELTVPLFVDGKLFGIIDSEHSRKGFFHRRHQRLLERVAAVCAERISKYLTEDRLRTKIARDLHDEMGSTLTSINILSKVAMERGQENDGIRPYLQKIKDHSGTMMESMSDIVWAINPANDSMEKLLIRMKEFAAELLEPVRMNYYFETTGLDHPSLLNLEERKDLYLIFKEAVHNATKYSEATELLITLRYDEGELLLRVADNGRGFDRGVVKAGNGLRNMEARARSMQAVLEMESFPGTGTRITLRKRIT
ncbi:MAG TPA: GAF domain-containing protein [Lacibacter sp.]|nr:GAF domain-containing protein [Lacibacter sp.]HMO90067.1 GAF domain-containing protein [Lacibacter sp.]HMP85746.1 GAF domain-containing protein [Lacibacter sp.]